MTLEELYENIGADYDQALRVLRMDKLIDKHICKLTKNGVIDSLIAAGDAMDPTQLFESAHAVKGICANLGLVGIAEAASDIAEEYRPGNPRTLSDDEVKEKIRAIDEAYQKTKTGIDAYVSAKA